MIRLFNYSVNTHREFRNMKRLVIKNIIIRLMKLQ